MPLDYTQLNPVTQPQWFKERIIVGNDIAIPANAGAGKVLTSDVDGNLTLQAPTGGGNSSGNKLYLFNNFT